MFGENDRLVGLDGLLLNTQRCPDLTNSCVSFTILDGECDLYMSILTENRFGLIEYPRKFDFLYGLITVD